MLFLESPIPTESTSPPAWVALAQLLRPQGRRGELLCDLMTDLDTETQFATGREVRLAPANANSSVATATPVTIESHWLPVGKNAGRIVLKLSSANSISEAELLAGTQLMVPASELPALDEDTFYVADLIGCTLFNAETPIGEVVDVEFATTPDGKLRLSDAAPLLAVQLINAPDDIEPTLIPFARAWLVSVDIAAKRIIMNLPDGLTDTTPV